MSPFAETIDRARKYVESSTLSGVDWDAELVQVDVGQTVQRLKQEPGGACWWVAWPSPWPWRIWD